MTESTTNPKSEPVAEESRRLGHEPNSLNMTFFWSVLGGLGVLLLISMILMGTFFDFLASRRQPVEELPPSLSGDRPVPVEPRLNPNQKTEMQQIRAAENKVLSTYGWLDKERGVARIPIERAMTLLVERGLPATKPSPASAQKSSEDPPSNGEKETK